VNSRRITLIVAVVLAIGTGILTLRYLGSLNQQAQQQQQQVALKPVVIVNKDVPARSKITPDELTTVSRPADSVPQQAIVDPKQAVGDVALVTIPQGSVITATIIGAPAAVGITYRLKPGMRAITIPVDRVKAVAGLIQPGDKVDVIAAVPRGPGIPPKAYTIIRGATVLAVNTEIEQTAQTPQNGASPAPDAATAAIATATVGVTPEQADLLTVADLNTTLRLALRSPQEPIRSFPAESLQFADLGQSNNAPAPAQPAPAPASNVPPPLYPAPAPNSAVASGPKQRTISPVIVIDGDKVTGGS
jgi:pilus assembly protein CpaB